MNIYHKHSKLRHLTHYSIESTDTTACVPQVSMSTMAARSRGLTAAICTFAMATGTLAQNFSISNVFGSNMVLQRNSSTTVIFGFGAPGSSVTTTGVGAPLITDVGEDGIWRQILPPQVAGLTPVNITCTSTSGTSQTLSNVLFGDVYLCGGQSNMQFTMSMLTNASTEVARVGKPAYEAIRIFTVGQSITSYMPLNEFGAVEQNWTVASPAAVYSKYNFTVFSAACWLFGRNIFDALGQQVPIGLISSNYEGTRIQAWSTNATNDLCNSSESMPVSRAGDAAGSAADDSRRPGVPPVQEVGVEQPGQNNATVLWNSMVHPYTVGPMALTGITWWQAEQNWNDYKNYSCIFPAMIAQWRKAFGDASGESLYFGFFVLQPWITGLPLQRLRDAQMQGYWLHKNVAFAAATDIGDPDSPFGSVHPRSKQAPSARLAASALSIIYGVDGLYAFTGPIISSLVGSNTLGYMTVTVNFEPQSIAGGGIVVEEIDPDAACPVNTSRMSAGWCAWPQLKASSGQWLNATLSASIDGTQLVFSAPEPQPGAFPVAIEYAHAPWPIDYVYSAASFDSGYETVRFPMLGFNCTNLNATLCKHLHFN